VSERSELPAEMVLAAARDFSDRRAQTWPDVYVEHLEVREVGVDHAEVTEGNPWIGYVWERLRYDWSAPHVLRGTVIDSNLFKRGSTWELWATPEMWQPGGDPRHTSLARSGVASRTILPTLHPGLGRSNRTGSSTALPGQHRSAWRWSRRRELPPGNSTAHNGKYSA
jgi:hypothetical protein